MGKNIKLNNKKTPAPAEQEKEKFYFFVKDQGEGAGRVFVIIFKVLELIGTSIYGLALGIFAPLCLMFGDFDPDIATNPALPVWLVTAIVYIIGTVVVMLGHSKIALGIHLLGVIGVLITYYNFMLLFEGIPDNDGPSVLYMPLLFLTIITAVIMMIINIPKWAESHAQKVNAVAPSILGDKEE